MSGSQPDPGMVGPISRPIVIALLVCFVPCAGFGGDQQVAAMSTQVALFRGFQLFPSTDTGMDILNAELSISGIPDYLGQVFDWDERQEASDWIQQFPGERSTLVLVGHSYGGNSALQLANNYLQPVGIDVDLTIQIDSVANPYGGWNDQLPANVDVGINYYQTGFFDINGEDFVEGATNINVEELFNDTSITHTSIDDDPRLHDLIGQNILDNLNSANADFDSSGYIDGLDFLLWQRGGSPHPLSGSDLALWEAQYGMAFPAAAEVTPTPEPSGLILCLLALAGVGWRLRPPV